MLLIEETKSEFKSRFACPSQGWLATKTLRNILAIWQIVGIERHSGHFAKLAAFQMLEKHVGAIIGAASPMIRTIITRIIDNPGI